MKRLHYIFLTLTIAWMAVIFIFSSQTGETSTNTSGTIVNFVISIFVPDFDDYNTLQQQETIDTISFIIRKGAHFTEYAILGLLCFSTVITHIWKKYAPNSITEYANSLRFFYIKCILGSLVFSCLYAISDELHQGFVANRSPAVFDVFVDTCGAFAGILFVYFVFKIYIRKKQSR